MKNLIFMSVLSLAVFAFAGCQAAETTNTTTTPGNITETTGSNAKPDDTKTSTSGLNPDSVDPEKPLQAAELNNAVLANPDSWKGKKVTVIGSYFGASQMSGTGGKYNQISIIDSKDKYDPKSSKRMSDIKVQVMCNDMNFTEDDRQVLVKDMKARDDRIVKGTIKEAKYEKVFLEPCEFVKK